MIQRILQLDSEIQSYEGKLDEKERKFKRQLEIDLLRGSVKFIAAHESTLIPKSDEQDEPSDSERESHAN